MGRKRGGKTSKKTGGAAKRGTVGGRKIRGRGNYSTFNMRGMAKKLDQALSAIPKGTFARQGARMGAKYGPLGALAGKGLGAGLAAVTGYGNYSVRANSLSKVSTSVDMIPQFVKNDHSIRVVHREFIKDLVVPTNPTQFNLQSFLINPANSTLFPWLATMARQYSQYKIHGMVFAFKTMSSDITAGGALGTVIMATNYNSIDRAFATKIEMENSEFAVSTKPSMSLIHAIECDPKYSGLDVLYVRDPSYETSDTNDRRFYDYGRFQVATTGLPGNVNNVMGELWVSYDIEFMKPVLGGTGLPTYVQGTTVLSRADGTIGVGTTSGMPIIRYDGVALSPSGSTSYSLLPATYTTAGDVLLSPGVVEMDQITAGRFYLRKNGTYFITIAGDADTTSTQNTLVNPSSASPIVSLTAFSGGAAAALEIGGFNNLIPSICSSVTATDGFGYKLTYTYVVTGITTTSDFIRFTPTTITTNATNLVTNWSRRLSVRWLSAGVNQEDPAYVETSIY